MICKSGLAAPKLHQTASWRREISAAHASHKRNWYGEAKWQYFPRFPFLPLFSAVLLLNLCAIDNLNSRHTVKTVFGSENFITIVDFLLFRDDHSCNLAKCIHSANVLIADNFSIVSCLWCRLGIRLRVTKRRSWTAKRIFLRKTSTRLFNLLHMHASRQLRTVRLLM